MPRANPISETVPKNPLSANSGQIVTVDSGLGKFFTTLADPSCREADRSSSGASLHLRLADNYLIKLWGHQSGNCTRTRRFEALDFSTHHRKAKRQGDGSWKQDRKLILLLPKKDPSEPSYLVSHSGQQPELQGNPVGKNSTQSVKQKPFVDYLYDQKRVSKGAWAYFLRTQGAEPKTFGYLLSSIHQKIQHRPDVLENILFDGGRKTRGRAVGRLYHQ